MMARKSKKQVALKTEKYPRKHIPVHAGKTDSETYRSHAVVTISPELAAYRVINAAERKSGLGEHIDVPALLETLRHQVAEVNRGDMTQAEGMLMNQATALQSLFARLAEWGMSCDTITSFEANMRMALRAQTQCRATLETLAAVKNPPIVYAKQANIAQGHQQVNNAASRAEEIQNKQTQLLEKKHGQRVDARTKGATSGVDSQMATVGPVDRTKNGKR